MEKLKLCIDCKHYEQSYILFFKNYDASKCKHPSVANPIDGSGDMYCSIERKNDCGRRAVNFELKT